MRRREPCIRTTVGNDERLHVERGTHLLFHLVPHTVEVLLGQNAAEIRMCGAQQAVIGIELTIGEPETVICTRIEPAGVVILGTVLEDGRSRTEVACDTVDKLDQIVGAGIEGSLTVFAVR